MINENVKEEKIIENPLVEIGAYVRRCAWEAFDADAFAARRSVVRLVVRVAEARPRRRLRRSTAGRGALRKDMALPAQAPRRRLRNNFDSMRSLKKKGQMNPNHLLSKLFEEEKWSPFLCAF